MSVRPAAAEGPGCPGSRPSQPQGDLPIARDLLEKERRRDHARLVLKQVHQKSGCHDGHLLHELLAAIREGQNAGLEDWELSFARKAVTDQRRLVA
mmetsp:Transcript_124037/g.396601  ORF Transcript_124037/g.396601 Transcript_124037/m.396601 type:complete len:96 (-) Transcript_124037:40-327(-)